MPRFSSSHGAAGALAGAAWLMVTSCTGIAGLDDYTSHNTERLDVAGVKKLLSTIDLTQDDAND